jgi:multiple sugar transport system ATP-binding protein
MLELVDVSHAYDGLPSLRGITLRVQDEVVALLGPSGAGKTTTLRLAAGLARPTAGAVRLRGVDVTDWPPQRRHVAMMFESYALYPHLTVYENCAFALRPEWRRTGDAVRERIVELARLLEIDALLDRHPHMLSGGQRQRVALCRTLVREPSLFCLDEPIAHLDAKLRHRLRGELKRLLRSRGVPTVWTTPDGLEAMAVADRLVVLLEGEVVQEGPPEEVYRNPSTAMVARLLGDPPINLLGATLRRDGDRLSAIGTGFSLALTGAVTRQLERRSGEDVLLGVRPSDVGLAREAGRGVPVEVYVYEALGKHGILTTRLGPQLVKVKLWGQNRFAPGEVVWLQVDPARLYVFDPHTGQRL